MASTPFTWGMGGQQITSPEQAKRQRAIADALVAQSSTPGQNWSEGLADIAAALSGTVLNGRVDEAEAAGRERAGGLFADLALTSSPDSIIAALTNPDSAWASDAQTSIASALLNQGLDRADPMYQIGLEKAQLELDALRNPVPSPYDQNAPTSYQEYQLGQLNPDYGATLGDSPLVTVNTGANNDFFTGLASAEGENFAGFLTAGQAAARNLNQVDRLDQLLQNSPTGLAGASAQLAGNLGIDIGGASGVQGAQALINTLVPQQRPPGSGPMSDADLELFKQSLPRIVNQPEGNRIIIDTIKAINNYDLQLAQITQEGLAAAEMTDDPQQRAEIRRQMRQQINSLANPIDAIRNIGSSAAPSGLPQGVTIRKISD